MSLDPSAWRAHDAVRFDDARDAANTATALLFTLADRGALEMSTAVARAYSIRLELLAVDGFDREAVDNLVNRFSREIAVIAKGAS